MMYMLLLVLSTTAWAEEDMLRPTAEECAACTARDGKDMMETACAPTIMKQCVANGMQPEHCQICTANENSAGSLECMFAVFPLLAQCDNPGPYSQKCDPYNQEFYLSKSPDPDFTLESEWYDTVDWEDPCPSEQRSESGCGDWKDMDDVICTAANTPVWSSDGMCESQVREQLYKPTAARRHTCVNQPVTELKLDNGQFTTIGDHREQWASHGEFGYLPAARYLHNMEHGTIVAVYDPCLAEEAVCQLRQFLQSVPAQDGVDFRWVLTPHVGLSSAMALGAYGFSYEADCFDEAAMLDFIHEHFNKGVEHLPFPGPYNFDHLEDVTRDSQCAALMASTPDAIGTADASGCVCPKRSLLFGIEGECDC